MPITDNCTTTTTAWIPNRTYPKGRWNAANDDSVAGRDKSRKLPRAMLSPNKTGRTDQVTLESRISSSWRGREREREDRPLPQVLTLSTFASEYFRFPAIKAGFSSTSSFELEHFYLVSLPLEPWWRELKLASITQLLGITTTR